MAAFQLTVRNYNLLKQKNVFSTYTCPILLIKSNTGRNIGPLVNNGKTELDKVCFVQTTQYLIKKLEKLRQIKVLTMRPMA